MKIKDISRQIQALIQERIDSSEQIRRTEVVQEIIASHGTITGEGKEFYTCCTQNTVYHIAKKVIDKLEKTNPEDNDQMALPMDGFSVKKAYSFPTEEGDDVVIIPIGQCTREQLEHRREEFLSQAEGLLKHAEGLGRYIKERWGP